MRYRQMNQNQKQEVKEILTQTLQQRFPSYDKVEDAEFTTGYDLEVSQTKRWGMKGMFREDSAIIRDIFNSSQDKYEADVYGQQGFYGFRIGEKE
jgi:hypothetical protein